jgi:ElaB/YqjD/DUF883 family membrane-anchored ribosome-binding protein
MYVTNICGDVAAGLWRATARAAANGMKPAKTAADKLQESRMTTTNGQKDTSTTTERFAAKAHDTVDDLSERAQRAEREVRGAAERTVERARELHDQYADTAEQSLRRATSYVESHPLAVAGMAFVAGVLLSSIIRR